MPCVYKHDFFVSYPSMPDRNVLTEFVTALVDQICFMRVAEQLPEPVYRDQDRLRPGFRWKPELSRALCHSRAMLAIYTDNYFSREYCQAEWNAMVELEMRRASGTTLPAMIVPILFRAKNDPITGRPILPSAMTELQYVDFRKIVSPSEQLKTQASRRKIQAILDRIDDLRLRSTDPGIDCDTFQFTATAPSASPVSAPYGGEL